MLASILRIIRDPLLRAPTVTLFLLGFTFASTQPYQSIIGINEFGMSDATYSVLIFAAAAINVAASILLGIVSDKLGDQRPLILWLTASGIVGFGLVYMVHSMTIFVLCVLVLLPINNSTFSILFGSIRQATNRIAPGEAISITAAVRAVYSGSWALIPGLVGLYLAQAQSMMPAFAVASIASAVCFGVYFFMTPKRQPVDDGTVAVGAVGFIESLGRLADRQLMLKLCGMALVTAAQRLNFTLTPLLITQTAHGGVADVGLISGGVALLEMPFMMLWARLQRRYHVIHLLVAGTVLYAAYLMLVSFATAPWQIYALLPLNACGAAAILCLPISYIQDMIADRPGLGSSLLAVNTFLSGGMGALLFAIGTGFGTYPDTARLDAVSALAAIAIMLALESRRFGGRALRA